MDLLDVGGGCGARRTTCSWCGPVYSCHVYVLLYSEWSCCNKESIGCVRAGSIAKSYSQTRNFCPSFSRLRTFWKKCLKFRSSSVQSVSSFDHFSVFFFINRPNNSISKYKGNFQKFEQNILKLNWNYGKNYSNPLYTFQLFKYSYIFRNK